MDTAAIFNRARWLLKDVKGSWATDQFLLEGMNHVYETAFLELVNINFPFDETVGELLAVPANTVDITAYDAAQASPLLTFMVTPQQIEWKIAGRPVTEYANVEKVDKVPDVGTGVSLTNIVSDLQAVIAYDFRSMAIHITPASIIVDLRIRFQQLFGELVGADGTLAINSIRPFLGARLAQITAGIRENYNLAAWIEKQGDNALSLIEANFI